MLRWSRSRRPSTTSSTSPSRPGGRPSYELPRVRARHYVYLVQSVEARFYGEEEQGKWATALAELTYTFGLTIITIAEWMQAVPGHPASRTGVARPQRDPQGRLHTRWVRRSADAGPGSSGARRGAVDVPMKRIGGAIALARAGGADEVWLMTGAPPGHGAGADRVFERVPVESTPTLYRSCDVLVKLSQVEGMYGPPLEMFHCGGTVVTYDVTGYEEYVDHGKNGSWSLWTTRTAWWTRSDTLKRDPALLGRLRARGPGDCQPLGRDWPSRRREFGRRIGIHRRAARSRQLLDAARHQGWRSGSLTVSSSEHDRRASRRFPAARACCADGAQLQLVVRLRPRVRSPSATRSPLLGGRGRC